jgi:hypothetical protein
MTHGVRSTRALIVAAGAVALLAAPTRAADPTPREVFEKRLMPIFKSPNPSSCVQCHLAGVDLKDYILPDHEKTFRSLRDQGLIDLDNPDRSKILNLIRMGEKDRPGPALIQEKARKAEYEAFATWIKACAEDSALRAAPKLDEKERARPAAADEVIRHGRKDRLLESFEQNVWAMRFRCMNCHTEGTPQNDKHRKEHGDKVAWVKKAGAEATMEYLIGSKLIDIEAPEKSLLLRKPLGEVKHEGGTKFAPGDQGYKGFRAWVEDVAAVRGGKHVKASDLPPKDDGPLRFGTELWLRLENTPPAWAEKLLQVNVYAWDPAREAWESEPVATSDRMVSGRGRAWQHTLTLLAPAGSERAKVWKAKPPRLPPGRYLVKVYVDRDGRLAKDWKAALGDAEYEGQAELQARWREGYGAMATLDARSVRK